jgi:hypothetical protein
MNMDRVNQRPSFGANNLEGSCAITAAHTKDPTAWWAAWAAHITNSVARHSIWDALDGNTSRLAHRLREGLTSPDEIAFVADLIEGKATSRRPRSGQPTRLANDLIVQTVFQYQMQYPNWPEKKIKGKVAKMFGVKERHLYNLLHALDPEHSKYLKRIAREIARR